jgi:glycosyltransferase involved in cell wall biosynthesis
MRILAIYRHYWPDTTPYARILRTILEHLADSGHEPVVFTAQPSYNDVRGPHQPWRETVGGVNVRRIRLLPERKRLHWLRAVNFAYFLFRAVMHALMRRRYDLVIANSHPPILMGGVLWLIRAALGTPYVYHCQDIHPEAAALAGNWRRSGLFRLLRGLDGAACRQARHVVVLSRDMSDALALRGLPVKNVSIINNPPLGESESSEYADIRISAGGSRDVNPQSASRDPQSPVHFLFAGNLGRFQALDQLVNAVRLLAGAPVQLTFMGEGAAKRELIEKARDLTGNQIAFLPQQSVAAARAAMRSCDYGVISLLPDVYRYAFPSKCMTYLSAGCPLLAVVEQESELARTIVRHDLGYVVSGQTAADVAAAMLRAAAERAKWTPGRRRAIQQTCAALFGEARMLAAWDQLVPPVRISPRTLAAPLGGAPPKRAA